MLTAYNRKVRKDATYPGDLWIPIITLMLVDKKTISLFSMIKEEVLQSTDSGTV